MNDLLSSIKADLLSKRMLPALVVLGALLLAAVAYAAAGGGSSPPASTGTVARAPSVSGTGPAMPIAPAPANPNQAVAETPGGVRYQHQSAMRDPFVPLPMPVVKLTTPAPTTTGISPSKSTTVSSGSSVAAAPPTTPSTPSAPKASKPVYSVAVQFGLAPATPEQTPSLTSFENLKRSQPLPSSKEPLLVFMGVSASGKGAIFTLVGAVILHGVATCMPSALQCQAIELAVGQTEELEYLSPTGQIVAYELKLVSITKSERTTAGALSFYRRQSKAGRALLRTLGSPVLAEMRFSMTKGVLVYTPRNTAAAAARRRSRERSSK